MASTRRPVKDEKTIAEDIDREIDRLTQEISQSVNLVHALTVLRASLEPTPT